MKITVVAYILPYKRHRDMYGCLYAAVEDKRMRPDLVPRVVVACGGQMHVHLACGLKLHGLAPELSLDASLLPEYPAGRRSVTRRNRRMVGHLKQHTSTLPSLIRKK